MLAGEAGAAVSDVALQELLAARCRRSVMRSRNAVHSGCGVPGGAAAHAVCLGDVVERIGRAADAGAQVNGPVPCRQEPRLGIPLRHRCRQTPIGSGKPLDGGHRLRRRDRADRHLARGCHLPANHTDAVEHVQRVIRGPASVVEVHPATPGRDVARVLCVPVGEGKRDTVLRGWWDLFPAILQCGQPDNVVIRHCPASAATPCRRSIR